jgi:dCMP deaminase
MNIAESVKTRSHDAETQFGAIFVKNGAIVATGYNGFIRGANDNILPNTRPLKYPYMVHAELNAIAHAARLGIALDGSTLYVRGSPCQYCTRILWQCGVKNAVIKEFHHTFCEVEQMKDIGVFIESKDGFYCLRYYVRP